MNFKVISETLYGGRYELGRFYSKKEAEMFIANKDSGDPYEILRIVKIDDNIGPNTGWGDG